MKTPANFHALVLFLAGALAVALIAIAASVSHGPPLIKRIERDAAARRDAAGGRGIRMSFALANGWLTRHPVLSGGRGLGEAARAHAAQAIASTPGVGGVHWSGRDASRHGQTDAASQPVALHCQQDVEALIKARTIRFDEASARIDRASDKVLDEVADALRPCLGGIIAVTGHTDSNGDATANLALSRARAESVRWALIGRGIPADGLRAAGMGSAQPLKGLASGDPANRRIEFSVIEKMPLAPTPIDTPGPG